MLSIKYDRTYWEADSVIKNARGVPLLIVLFFTIKVYKYDLLPLSTLTTL
jgi:hypothetical protein